MHDARAGARRGSKEPGLSGATVCQQPAPMMHKIPEVMVMLRMSRHAIYDQIHRGRLRIVKQGRATFVTPAAVRAYVELLEREAEAGAR
jgi:Helix-turn-helix domain